MAFGAGCSGAGTQESEATSGQGGAAGPSGPVTAGSGGPGGAGSSSAHSTAESGATATSGSGGVASSSNSAAGSGGAAEAGASSSAATSSSASTSSTGGGCNPIGEEDIGNNSDLCQSYGGRFKVGKPSAYAAGLHAVAGRTILIGRDAGGLYALTSLCTHACCDVTDPVHGSFQAGKIVCKCHGSEFTTTGAVTKGPAKKPLDTYDLVLDCDGFLYVDTTKVVPATQRVIA